MSRVTDDPALTVLELSGEQFDGDDGGVNEVGGGEESSQTGFADGEVIDGANGETQVKQSQKPAAQIEVLNAEDPKDHRQDDSDRIILF